MVLQEQHGRDDDIGTSHVIETRLKPGRAVRPLGSGVHRQANPGQLLSQAPVGPFRSGTEVTVHRHDGHLHERRAALLTD